MKLRINLVILIILTFFITSLAYGINKRIGENVISEITTVSDAISSNPGGNTRQAKVSENNESPELPKSLIPVLSKSLGRDNISYHITKESPGVYRAKTRSHKFSTIFTEDGISVSPEGLDSGSWQWGLALKAVGYGENISPVSSAQMVVSAKQY